MKRFTFLLITLFGFLFTAAQTITITPEIFAETDQVTITVTNFDPDTEWGVSDIYYWGWYFDLNDVQVGDSPTNGAWTNSNEAQKFTNNPDGSYTFTFTPTTLYNDTGIGRIGFLLKADNGNDGQTADNLVEVGLFQTSLTNPTNPITVLDSGSSLSISATSTVDATFELKANGTVVNTQMALQEYSFDYTLNEDTTFELTISEVGTANEEILTFEAIITPTPNESPVPMGMKDGANLDPMDPTTATFVLYAPGKDFVHLKGNFSNNDWTRDNTFLMNKDSASDRFWITLTGLPASGDVLYQYLIDAEISVGDPYSTLILSPFNDGEIDEITFPNLPAYPQGKTTDAVSWIKTGETPYVWQVTDFERPAVTDLVIYELLIRDFDALHSFDAVTARLDYLVDLGINAIELLPVSEFDGNNSWGYNPSFHMALDKYYGTPTAFKEFVDACHAKGIAVILDVVYNQGTGQNPYYRMWNDCSGCYGGKATAENPFYNIESPNTNFSFFNDLDHESPATQAYIDRLNEFWLKEYNIDGYRFDFTKGFSNTVGDGEAYDQSRIDILKRMNAEIKKIDPEAYVILEHLATNLEETELINDGMLVWSNLNFTYNQASMGYGNSDFGWISYKTRGWTTPANIAYMESHDEERLMYRNLEFGNSSVSGTYNVKDLATALDRVELAGAFYFTIPGPKMIWQFGELGYDFSINYCTDGTVDESCRTGEKPIRWDYLNDTNRKDVYDLYAKLINQKKNAPIFKTTNFTLDVAAADVKKIHLTDDSATGNEIKYVTIIGNFDTFAKNVIPGFQETGEWYDMLDDNATPIMVNDVNAPINLLPGEFRIYSNERSVLDTPDFTTENSFRLTPNPVLSTFSINQAVKDISVYNISGVMVREFKGDFSVNTSFDISSLPTGFYLIKAKDSKGFISSVKLIKE